MEIMKKTLLFSAGLLMGIGVSAAQDVPKAEVSLGYSFINVHPEFPQITSYNINGGAAGFVFNATHYFGIKAEFGDYVGNGGAQLRAAGYNGNVSGNFFSYMFGPQIKKHSGKFQPFGEALFGAAHSGTQAQIYDIIHGITNPSGGSSNNTFAMELGLGTDIPVGQHVSIRPVEVDYLFTEFSANQVKATQNNFRYFGGIVFTMGGKPLIPPTASCSTSPTEIMSGDPVTANVSTQNFDPKHTITYSWSGSGGKVSGTGQTANIDTTGLAPGSYTVSAAANDAKEKKNNVASCSASFTVKPPPPRPPTANCSVSPQTIKPGDTFGLLVAARSPDNSPLSYSYSASAGNISGTGSNATESTTAANANSTITVTANVVDARGLTASCSATVTVLPFPVVTVPEVSQVGECKFNMSQKPGRVDNECKAVLDEVALRVQREPNDTLVVVGYTDETETVKMTQLAGQRAVNVKYYLTAGEGGAGIDPSRIQVKAGTVKSKSARLYIVPSGATFAEESTLVDETQVKGQPRNAPTPKKSKKTTSN
jgi:hypothetical protein